MEGGGLEGEDWGVGDWGVRIRGWGLGVGDRGLGGGE